LPNVFLNRIRTPKQFADSLFDAVSAFERLRRQAINVVFGETMKPVRSVCAARRMRF
jgi:hypothetical protein